MPRVAPFFLILVGVIGLLRQNAQAFAASALSFDEAVSALSSNENAERLDRALMESAESRGKAAWQVYFPEVSAAAQRSQIKERDDPISGADLNVDLNLYRFGADRADANAGFAAKSLAAKSSETNRLKREYGAARKLLDLLYGIKLLEKERQFSIIKENSLVLTQKLYARGLKPAQDVTMLEIDSTKQKSAVSTRESYVDEILAEIKSSTSKSDLPISAEWAVDWPWTEAFGDNKGTAFAKGIPSDGRLASAISLQQKAEAEASYKKALSRGAPSFDLNYNNRWERSHPAEPLERTWKTTLSVSIPLYQRGFNEVERAEAHSKVIAAENAIANERQQWSAKLDLYQKKLARLGTQVQSRRSTSVQAKQLYEQSLLGFQRGIISVNDLATDQLRYLDSEKIALDNWHEIHLALIDYCELIEQNLSTCVKR
ncbi:MAG: TolC family protein [Proteobacteria bacterium]|nr:TolC family protein [Pseudomonadota bacterium]